MFRTEAAMSHNFTEAEVDLFYLFFEHGEPLPKKLKKQAKSSFGLTMGRTILPDGTYADFQ